MSTLHLHERESFDGRVIDLEPTGRYLAVNVDPGPFFKTYERPGQYAVVRFPGASPRFLAISSAPGASVWRFLVDPSKGGLEPILERLEPNAGLEISYPEGPGYPEDFERFQNILVICTGSGVASVMGMLENWPSALPSEFIYAEALDTEFAWPEELRVLTQRAGIGLRLVSNGQRIEEMELTVHGGTAVILCGSEASIDYFSELLISRGANRKNIFTNLAWRP